METEVFELRGHIIDSLILPKVLDEIVEAQAEYRILTFEVGKSHEDVSSCTIEVTAPDLSQLIGRLQSHGANPRTTGEAKLVPTDADGVFPEGFYSTTNLETHVRVKGSWIPVAPSEMDCGILVFDGAARTIPVSDVRKGDLIVCGHSGVKVFPLEKPRSGQTFSFMSSEVSSEKPQGLMVQRVAEMARTVKVDGKKILWVLGPAVVHTGSVEAFCSLVRSGWVDVVFAGNALATHDSENAIYGTSLGVSLSEGLPIEHGHEHHIRAINSLRRAGSFPNAVSNKVINSGIMYHLVKHNVPYVLAGSIRDDGPMPEVIPNVLDAQRVMRTHLEGLGMAIMIGTMLHSIATGNLLPASVPIVCVDINPAAVTKLVDRGSIQSLGIVTDVGLFLRQLADTLGAAKQ
ncbi:MAG: ornithine cyclodeaminase, nickel-pincer nucleotide-dependent [Actinomycetota bacterium]